MFELPDAYTAFREEFPEVAEAYDALGSAAHEAGPLDDRTRQLVKLAIAIGGRQEGATKGHIRRAIEMGITPDEVKHAILLALTTAGFPATVAAYAWLGEVLGEG
jgi:alkylhydroperoxidase/carboxymuconolactone decarboxylase family protein YurZ